MNKETINKTKYLLNLILDYSKKEPVSFFYESRGYFYRFFVSSNEGYQNLKEPGTNVEYNLVDTNFLNSTDLDIFLHKGNMNCSLQAAKELQPKYFNELLLEVFWSCDKETAKIFFEHFDFEGKNINFNYIINYSNEKFPKGFADDKVRPYDKGLNWHHFLDMLPGKSIVNFFEDEEKREQFFKLMKDCESSDGLKANSFLNKIRMKIEESEIKMSQNASVEMSYLLMDLYSEKKDTQKAYAVVFPFMTSLIEEEEKNELFQQDELIIEKITLRVNDIYRFFNNKEIKAEKYEKLTESVINYIGENSELIKLGLINLDVAKQNRDFICYLNLSSNKITKDFFLKIYKDSMNTIINNKEILEDSVMGNNIKDVVSKVVSFNILNDDLSQSTKKDKKFKI